MDLIESIALEHKGWQWSGKETQERVKLYFSHMGCDFTISHDSEFQFPKIYEIVDRAITEQNHDLAVLIQQAATTKLPTQFQLLQSDIETKTSILCLSKALLESIQTKMSCLDKAKHDRGHSAVNNSTDTASGQGLDITASLPPDML
jgi:hypothetical protein